MSADLSEEHTKQIVINQLKVLEGVFGSRDALSKAMGIPGPSLSQYMNGNRAPSFYVLATAMRRIGVRLDFLLAIGRDVTDYRIDGAEREKEEQFAHLYNKLEAERKKISDMQKYFEEVTGINAD